MKQSANPMILPIKKHIVYESASRPTSIMIRPPRASSTDIVATVYALILSNAKPAIFPPTISKQPKAIRTKESRFPTSFSFNSSETEDTSLRKNPEHMDKFRPPVIVRKIIGKNDLVAINAKTRLTCSEILTVSAYCLLLCEMGLIGSTKENSIIDKSITKLITAKYTRRSSLI